MIWQIYANAKCMQIFDVDHLNAIHRIKNSSPVITINPFFTAKKGQPIISGYFP